jgi:type I restriction enzyme S subunit
MGRLKNIPNLRFPEFEGEWETRNFGDIATNKSGKYNPLKETNSVKCIELEHLSSESSQLIDYIDGKNSGSIKNKFEKGDVLFGKLRPYLKKYLLAPFDGVCSSEIWVLKGINISNEFLFRIVQTDNFIDLANQSSGSKMPRADWDLVKNGIFSFPSLPEQTKIASFLTAVDDKLQALKQKLTLLEQYKKGVMQKIFAQELRFKPSPIEVLEIGDEYPDWEEKKLGDICEITIGEFVIRTKQNPFGKYPVFNGGKSYTGLYDEFNNEGNKIIISARGANAGFVNFQKERYWAGNSCYSIDVIDKKIYNIFYFFYYIKMFESNFTENQQAANIPSVSKKDVEKFIIQLPFYVEQTKIASFLSAIDEKIEKTTQQLTQTETFKKGLLQQLFV